MVHACDACESVCVWNWKCSEFSLWCQVQPLLRVRSLLTEVGREQSSPFGITVVLVFVGFRA